MGTGRNKQTPFVKRIMALPPLKDGALAGPIGQSRKELNGIADEKMLLAMTSAMHIAIARAARDEGITRSQWVREAIALHLPHPAWPWATKSPKK